MYIDDNMEIIDGINIYLRKLTLDDCNDEYLSWMNDYDVVKYLESRFSKHSINSLKDFVSSVNNSDNNVIFAIIDKFSNKHIGNIKLGNINKAHNFADIGIIIGDKNYWGKGIATEAIKLVCNYAFNEVNLRKVIAGAYDVNIGSIKAFEKNGFKKAYVKKSSYFFENNYIDAIYLELYNENFKEG